MTSLETIQDKSELINILKNGLEAYDLNASLQAKQQEQKDYAENYFQNSESYQSIKQENSKRIINDFHENTDKRQILEKKLKHTNNMLLTVIKYVAIFVLITAVLIVIGGGVIQPMIAGPNAQTAHPILYVWAWDGRFSSFIALIIVLILNAFRQNKAKKIKTEIKNTDMYFNSKRKQDNINYQNKENELRSQSNSLLPSAHDSNFDLLSTEISELNADLDNHLSFMAQYIPQHYQSRQYLQRLIQILEDGEASDWPGAVSVLKSDIHRNNVEIESKQQTLAAQLSQRANERSLEETKMGRLASEKAAKESELTRKSAEQTAANSNKMLKASEQAAKEAKRTADKAQDIQDDINYYHNR
ncbi:polysaccharide biosynthesis protein [Pediococcus argentinicus]|uniref:Uncharacterized protein n=1 Tax=Pediococcus argentinicus TaxID=480391 RepID=A0A0R2NFS3_9LACO|nr:hypothetical protein [Pediococcus argentinicus]KRO24673.1 hypothetical protein IV88_GL000803 [Pediococcus argentinicus]NKZ22792.1 hypothetical protein [Pediococcus argentinicus]GEP19837.1 hypothetical protein LSA03_12210 [Pediococcus argentinicus]